jgi:NAD(P)-dependent dehydrogenase (short-subunit alcohol dehydrogenase family)
VPPLSAGVERFGGLDGVVNVAAYDAVMGTLLDMDADTFPPGARGQRLWLHQPRPGCRPGAQDQRRGSGRADRLAVGDEVQPGAPGGVRAVESGAARVARDLANDLGPDGIRVNTVVPSWMWGPNVQMYCQWQASERGVEPEDIKNELASANALRAMAADTDVAESVMFFLSDRSSMITGQRLLVNAGEYFDT